MRALCIVLQLGNLDFIVDPKNEDASIIEPSDEFDKLSDILGIPTKDISKALTVRKVTARDEVLWVPLNRIQAKDACDACAKEIYSCVFDWLVSTINDATCAEQNYLKEGVEEFRMIGLLDIFGFESFEINRFEQLCINHANERLQQKFTADVFDAVMEEYKSEGITICDVKFEGNTKVLSLIEGRLGLIDLLNEECLRPRGNDEGFVNKIYANNKKSDSPLFSKRGFQRNQFAITHYAGPVTYNATKFVMKNMDTLSADVFACIANSSNRLIRTEFKKRQEEDAKRTDRRAALLGKTVWTKFRTQLNALMTDLSSTRAWYVRCINPNMDKAAGVMDLKYTVTQLRYAGIVDAVTIARATFPNRLEFSQVMKRFRFLASHDFLKARKIHLVDERSEASRVSLVLDQLLQKVGADLASREKQSVNVLLDHLLKSQEVLDGENAQVIMPFVCGETKVFFRTGALEYLESQRLLAYDRCATLIQSRFRRNIAVEQFSLVRLNPPTRSLNQEDSFPIMWFFSTILYVQSFLEMAFRPFTFLFQGSTR
mmetsp:Transcript_19831/g.35998  ORF Transcript_19831/g.35998 Transcript_19831/m.35998 type:complete len:543 (-) Transcript_19831:230-1858(-)